MKRMKKLLAVMLAVVMVMSLGTSAWADGTTYTITITNSNGESDHTYSAYQIFTGELSGTNESSYVLSNIGWADTTLSTAILTQLKTMLNSETTYTLNSETKNMSAWLGVTDSTTELDATEFAEVLSDFYDSADFAQDFADLVGDIIKAGSYTATKTVSSGTSGVYTISDLPAGYYIVIDETTLTSGSDDTVSSYILKVVGDVQVTTKELKPSLDKTITSVAASGETNKLSADSDTVTAEVGDVITIKHNPSG